MLTIRFVAEAELVTARHELEMRDMDRRLREEQDLEFQRTMEADRKRIEEENKKKQEEEDKIRAAEEKANERIRRVTEHRVGNFTHFHPSFTLIQSNFIPFHLDFTHSYTFAPRNISKPNPNSRIVVLAPEILWRQNQKRAVFVF